MLRLKNQASQMLEIEKSKFYCFASRCFSDSEAREFIAAQRKQHPRANHHCSAYVIGEHHQITRSSDDREPSGTAGIPMLEALKRSGLHDCICVVVRYFGGIKLGAGGLVRAYSNAISQTLHSAEIMQVITVQRYCLVLTYSQIGKIDYILQTAGVHILDKLYEEDVQYIVQSTDTAWINDIVEHTGNTVGINFMKKECVEMPFTAK